MSETSKIIEIRDLKKEDNEASGSILRVLSFDVNPGDFIAVMGRSGCGKTTFLKILGLVLKKSSGTYLFRDRNIDDLWESEIADIRRREMGFVYQNYNLMQSLTARENIELPAVLDKTPQDKRSARCMSLMEEFGIAHLAEKYPYEMSGGEQQRVGICRALINDPDLILADEPTGNLDSVMGETVIRAFQRMNREMGKAVIIVTHDPKIAARCRKTVHMKDGVFTDPEQPHPPAAGQASE